MNPSIIINWGKEDLSTVWGTIVRIHSVQGTGDTRSNQITERKIEKTKYYTKYQILRTKLGLGLFMYKLMLTSIFAALFINVHFHITNCIDDFDTIYIKITPTGQKLWLDMSFILIFSWFQRLRPMSVTLRVYKK